MTETLHRSTVLHYCHHSVGLGHLVRSLAVAAALAEHHRVVLCCGGRIPPGLAVPPGVEVVPLPPIGRGTTGALASQSPGLTLEDAWERRRAQLLGLLADLDPEILLIELFPFGRRKFAGELLALLERSRASAKRPTIISSVRDLLVSGHPDKQRHDDEAAARLDAFFDAVIVHGDARFARLEETFRPAVFPRVPILYSGFVRAEASTPRVARRPSNQVVVSAGGGLSGGRLFAAAVAAHKLRLHRAGFTTRIITGPFLPATDFASLSESADRNAGLYVERFVGDLSAVMADSAVSVSQCGYNTSLDILTTRTPAVVVPFAEAGDDEQLERARRLSTRDAVAMLAPGKLSAPALAEAVLSAARRPRRPRVVDLSGATTTATLIADLAAARAA